MYASSFKLNGVHKILSMSCRMILSQGGSSTGSIYFAAWFACSWPFPVKHHLPSFVTIGLLWHVQHTKAGERALYIDNVPHERRREYLSVCSVFQDLFQYRAFETDAIVREHCLGPRRSVHCARQMSSIHVHHGANGAKRAPLTVPFLQMQLHGNKHPKFYALTNLTPRYKYS